MSFKEYEELCISVLPVSGSSNCAAASLAGSISVDDSVAQMSRQEFGDDDFIVLNLTHVGLVYLTECKLVAIQIHLLLFGSVDNRRPSGLLGCRIYFVGWSFRATWSMERKSTGSKTPSTPVANNTSRWKSGSS